LSEERQPKISALAVNSLAKVVHFNTDRLLPH
jgi:hypothetical protein